MTLRQLYKHVDRAVCYTCGQEWFGRDGDVQAQSHADDTGHNVVVTVTTRETFNGDLVGDAIPAPVIAASPAPRIQFEPPAPIVEAEPRPMPRRSAGGRVAYAGADAAEHGQLARAFYREAS